MPRTSDHTASRPRVLVLGGGFGGVGAARELSHADVDVTLVDQHDYHTFQPLLYQVATDLLEPPTVGHPLRDLFGDDENVTVHEASVSAIDLDRREVEFTDMHSIGYDYLVLGLGVRANFFGVDGAAEHAHPLYTLPDAIRLRNHVLERWEAADRDPALVEDGALSVVIVGGGATGIESAGAMAELYRSIFSKDYPNLPQESARIVLVEAGPSLLPMFKADIRTYSRRALEKRGVEVLTDEVVASIAATRVTLKSGTVLRAHTVVWGAGLEPLPLTETLPVQRQRGGRVVTAADLSIPGHPEAYAVGDMAWITGEDGQTLPQLGSVALQSGGTAGQNVARQVEGKDTKPFSYDDKGTMATIGRGAAVVQLPHGRTIKGKTASLAWGAVHLALLSTGEDRAKALLDWTWAGFSHERPGRISVTADDE